MSWPSSRSSAEPRADGEPGDAALAALAHKDPQAFAALYARYLAPVYRYCYLHLGSRLEAEDAAGKVFLKVLAGLSDYRGGIFAAWLFRVARSVVIDVTRTRHPVQTLEATPDPPDPALGPEEATLVGAEREALRTALASLPVEQRAAIELQLAGWSGEEIAGALGKSPAAVKMLRLRALRRLRALLTRGEAPGKERNDGSA